MNLPVYLTNLFVMKIVNMRKRDIKQFYVLPTIVVSKSYMGRRSFICWLFYSIEL